MYAESNVTSSKVHMVHTELTLREYVRILLYSRVLESRVYLLRALIVKSKRLAVVVMATIASSILSSLSLYILLIIHIHTFHGLCALCTHEHFLLSTSYLPPESICNR